MEFLVASAIGLLAAAGIYLLLRGHTFPVVLGLALLTYAINLFLFVMGRLTTGTSPIIDPSASHYPDPLPQALVLTAIVIAFGMSAFVVVLALRAYLDLGSDQVDGRGGDDETDAAKAPPADPDTARPAPEAGR